MIIAQTHDMQAVKRFMLLPEVYRYAAEHTTSKEKVDFSPDPSITWLACVEESPIGLIKLEQKTQVMCEFHPYILRKHKDKYDEMVICFFKWFCQLDEKIVKLNAVIADCFNGAIAAAERAGMTQEGLDRSSYMSKTGIRDRILFGITRDEMIINGGL